MLSKLIVFSALFLIKVCCSDLNCYHGNQTDHCFLFRSGPRDWKSAQLDCGSLGGHLAMVKDTKQQLFMELLMTSQKQRTIWIGGQDLEDKLWSWVDTETPLKEQGCYKDDFLNKDLDIKVAVTSLTPERCVMECQQRNFTYAGVQAGDTCYCGNSFGQYGISNKCYYPCVGEGSKDCGGFLANSIYYVYGTYGTWVSLHPDKYAYYQHCGVVQISKDFNMVDRDCYDTYQYICRIDPAHCSGDNNGTYFSLTDQICVFVSHLEVTWLKAREDCLRRHGDIFTIHADVDKEPIKFGLGQTDVTKDFVWIGVTKKLLQWLDGTRMTYTNWVEGSPTKSISECVEMDSMRGFGWSDIPCRYNNSYFCQIDGNMTELTELHMEKSNFTTSTANVFEQSTIVPMVNATFQDLTTSVGNHTDFNRTTTQPLNTTTVFSTVRVVTEYSTTAHTSMKLDNVTSSIGISSSTKGPKAAEVKSTGINDSLLIGLIVLGCALITVIIALVILSIYIIRKKRDSKITPMAEEAELYNEKAINEENSDQGGFNYKPMTEETASEASQVSKKQVVIAGTEENLIPEEYTESPVKIQSKSDKQFHNCVECGKRTKKPRTHFIRKHGMEAGSEELKKAIKKQKIYITSLSATNGE